MRYYIKIEDQYGNTANKLVTKKELNTITKYNPQLKVTVEYNLTGNGKWDNE